MPRILDTESQRPSWARPLLEPVLLLSNAMFFVWFRLAKRTATVQHRRAAEPDGRALYYMWHKHAWILTAVADELDLPDTAWLGHDGFFSLMVQRVCSWSGTDVLRFSRRSKVAPAAQIIEAMRSTQMSLGVATDSGGPYGRVKEGLIKLASTLDAQLVPLAFAVDGVPKVGATMRHELPWPHMRVTIEAGEPLPRDVTVSQAQEALEQLEMKLRTSAADG